MRKQNRHWLVLIVGLFVLGSLAAGVAGAGDLVTVVDQFNRVVEVDPDAQRIVSVAPSNTEILIELGVADRIVGRTDFCEYPEVESVASIGSITPLNIEAVVSLEPDLIVAHSMTGEENVDRLAGFGIPVVALHSTTLADAVHSIEIIGQSVGADERAAKLLAGIAEKEAVVRAAADDIAAKGLKVLFVIHDDDPLWTAGPGSFIHEAIELAGAHNIAGDAASAWVQMDTESIVARDPDVILVGSDPNSFYDGPRWQTLAAVEKGQVYQINTDAFNRPTPGLWDSILYMAELLADSE